MECSNDERENRISVNCKKDDKKRVSAKSRRNDNKREGNENDISKSFPNFMALTEEERVAFFEALTTARKNVEKSVQPTRQGFGTVHDEYLRYFDDANGDARMTSENDEELFGKVDSIENSQSTSESGTSSSVTSVQNVHKNCNMRSTPDITSMVEKLTDRSTLGLDSKVSIWKERSKTTLGSKDTSLLTSLTGAESWNECHPVLKKDEPVGWCATQKAVKIEECWLNEKLEKDKIESLGKSDFKASDKQSDCLMIMRQGDSSERKDKENIQPENKKKDISTRVTNMPRFDALTSEEKDIFFNILKEAHDNVLEKNPEKKSEIVSLDTILKSYQNQSTLTPVYSALTDESMKKEKNLPKETGRNIKVKVTITSADNERLAKEKSKTLRYEEEETKETAELSENVSGEIKPSNKSQSNELFEKESVLSKKENQVEENEEMEKKKSEEEKVTKRNSVVKLDSYLEKTLQLKKKNEEKSPKKEKQYNEKSKKRKSNKKGKSDEEVDKKPEDGGVKSETKKDQLEHVSLYPMKELQRGDSLLEIKQTTVDKNVSTIDPTFQENEYKEEKRGKSRKVKKGALEEVSINVGESMRKVDKIEEVKLKSEERKEFIRENGLSKKLPRDDLEVASKREEIQVEVKSLTIEQATEDSTKQDICKECDERKSFTELKKMKKDEEEESCGKEKNVMDVKSVTLENTENQNLLSEVVEPQKRSEENEIAAYQKTEEIFLEKERRGQENTMESKPTSAVETKLDIEEVVESISKKEKEELTVAKESKKVLWENKSRQTLQISEDDMEKKLVEVKFVSTEQKPEETIKDCQDEHEEKLKYEEKETEIQQLDVVNKSQEDITLENSETKDTLKEGKSVPVEKESQFEKEKEKKKDVEEEAVKVTKVVKSEVVQTFATVEDVVEVNPIQVPEKVSQSKPSFVEDRPMEVDVDEEAEKIPEFKTGKVVLVDDGVIEKIKKLIQDLEKKAKREESDLENEYLQLLLGYIEYLSKILESLISQRKRKVQHLVTAAEVHLKFDDQSIKKNSKPKSQEEVYPRSVSDLNLADVPTTSGSKRAEPKDSTNSQSEEKSPAKKPSLLLNVDSDSGSSIDSNDLEDHQAPMAVKKKLLPSTKIRLLQDLLKDRAKFVEGSLDDFKIVHLPKEEYVPEEKTNVVMEFKDEDEESTYKGNKLRFFRALAKFCRCWKKDSGDGNEILENLKGEAVAVDVSEGKTRDATSVTLNESTMKVLKAAERKKVIQKYYRTQK